MSQPITVRVLNPDEAAVLDHVAPDVFDGPVDPRWTAEFFADARHHLAVALHGETVVGVVGAFRYVYPDKPPELFINEVAVSPGYRGRGLGRGMMNALTTHARALGCVAAWVLTEAGNTAARRLYAASGGLEESCQIFVIPLEQAGTGPLPTS
ncbi:GNAT family N-acetyltransferase [Deinococcus metallilatus]|uniref:GNAT family N-acetyltransferase n=1 Tax=Deinococcus metallilatus TaxID=1211322 RepID=A0AAJ5F600_9DEIO|nr:GNAT family N-acetyltransferase [Deinococcus metallilatus]MBB5294360.1 ribosomal protein S18 acetylase RimI-like enzyme [Deinococcus metallilatus]QBY09126.1 GNAT family N-acetyltransferase [Deinococcus metallilatus]RXJ10270.1 GNAT family N-acetyltransferase [Deinococcus metallilatus]TLK22562.1 GNAT family N-acetyltransferase [Deinococcus metallilatus]GMA16303.1 GNAT family N-acetyltransferase [Deinococcus metallilatus]